MKDSPRHPGTASVSREQNIRTEVHQKYQPQISQIFHIKETHLDPQNTIWCNFPKLIFTNNYTLHFLQLAEKPWICYRKPSWHQNCPVFPMNVNGQLTKYHSWFTQGPLPFYIHPSVSSQVFIKISSTGWRWKFTNRTLFFYHKLRYHHIRHTGNHQACTDNRCSSIIYLQTFWHTKQCDPQ